MGSITGEVAGGVGRPSSVGSIEGDADGSGVRSSSWNSNPGDPKSNVGSSDGQTEGTSDGQTEGTSDGNSEEDPGDGLRVLVSPILPP